MDGQDLWNQNFCSVCDCLIPPGTGVGIAVSHTAKDDLPSPKTATIPMSKTSSASSGLKSTTGTIKARPTSSEGPKRTSSSTKLDHPGPSRRQGSSSSRLNALSDLKPTTRINGDQQQQQKNSPKVSRRSSNTSVKSTSTTSSGPIEPESPSVSSSTTSLPRSRKGGLLGGLTPAALRQQEQEAHQAKAAPALYCSERCRAIDEQTSPNGLAELSLYSSQPPNMMSTSAWLSSASNPSPEAPFPPRIWPRTASTTSIPLTYGNAGAIALPSNQTPDSECAPCTCADCLERLSAGGIVPSGASDTTESSSSGYWYGVRSGSSSGGYYRTQRSRSGRIVTPQNLYPPHGADDGYFPASGQYAGSVSAGMAVEPSTSSSSRKWQSSASGVCVPGRTASAASGRSATNSSAQSPDSAASMWEPVIKKKRPSQPSGTTSVASNLQRGLGASPAQASKPFDDDTNTPASSQITVGKRRVSEAEPNARSIDTIGHSSRQRSSVSTPSGSLPTGVSPLHLLRNSKHRASPSVDVNAGTAQSISVNLRGPLSTSVTSEHTLGTSAQTLVNPESSLRERRYGTGKGLLMHFSDSQNSSTDSRDVSRCSSRAQAGVSEDPRSHTLEANAVSAASSQPGVSSAQGLSLSYSDRNSSQSSSALQALKAASHRSPQPLDGTASLKRASADSSRRESTGSSIFPSASSGWLKSLSSALTSMRGPPTNPPTIVVPDNNNSPNGFSSPIRPDSAVSQNRSVASASPSARSGVTAGSDGTSASNLSRSAASESLSRMLAHASLDTSKPKASASAGVARPDPNRGKVPDFAREIGHGLIPGEAEAARGRSDAVDGVSRGRASAMSTSTKSSGGSQAMSDETEEKKRRRAEHRHQRSKDVTMLPPLLAPSQRSSTALNAHNRANSYVNLAQQRNRSRSRSSVNGGGAAFTVGSYGSSYTPSRPVTPGLASPGLRATRPLDSDTSLAGLNRVGSQQDVTSSARRATLGWAGSAMTPIAPSPTEGLHPASIGNGHAAQASHYLQRHHNQHAHSHHHHHGHTHSHALRPAHARHGHHQSTGHAHAGHPVPGVSRSGHSLGHLGLLGHHPHGSQPVYGRHNTMPVRSSTPIVPEHGGEMSAAAFAGAEVADRHTQLPHQGQAVDRPHSAIGHRRGSQLHSSSQMPSRPGSSAALRTIAASPRHGGQAQPGWSYDNLANVARDAKSGGSGAVRTYPLLQLPNREETHDRYDDAWSNAVELIAGPEGVKMAEEERARRLSLKNTVPTNGDLSVGADGEQRVGGNTKRKQLFHFGA